MSLAFSVLVLLGSICVVTIPVWSFSRKWGYLPSGIILGLIVLVTIVSLTSNVNLLF
ncbi:DUF3309 family protein [Thalassospira lucentensis]|uniref:DUF3309 domain-containing protein n=1 Tax=Thalassospira lucentensis TaxID=168935 RepID=A0A358HRA7_9PROT|nr:DUF3309 domain-containing protein [Thalassospira lucentensis]HCW67946.1 DUF3309 domain-containing protein [Thalassospira lucentensis]